MATASVVGRGWVVLMVNVIYQGRALPIAWTVVRRKHSYLGYVSPNEYEKIAKVA